MNPPKVKCSVCGNEVNKRQTLSIGDGKRACKDHENVSQLAEKAQETVEKKNQAVNDKYKRKQERQESFSPFSPRCFCCNCQGMHKQDWYARLLVLGEKYHLTYGKPLNPFSSKETTVAYAELKGIAPLFYQEYKPELRLYNHFAKQAAILTGFVLMCPECCKKHNIQYMPEIPLETLQNFASVAELIRPEIQKQAKQELEACN